MFVDKIDFTFDEYQANVLRTANRELDWNETIENCLYGLIGELAEIIENLNTDNVFLNVFVGIGKSAEDIKKYKYHGKELDKANYEEKLYLALLTIAEHNTKFNIQETANLQKELGDLQYYHTWLCDVLGYEASEVAQANVEKLRKRYGDGFSVEKSLNRQD